MKTRIDQLLALPVVMWAAIGLMQQTASGQCVSPPSGLVCWWPGDGNANDIQGTNNGAFTNGAMYASGRVGQAFSFNGTNAVVVPDSPALRFTNNDLTVEGWLQAPPGSTDRRLLQKEGEGGNYPSLNMHIAATGLLGFSVTDIGHGGEWNPSSRYEVFSTNRVDDNLWHHFAGVRITNGYQLYVDGQLAGTRSETARNSDNSYPLKIGTAETGAFGFIGLVDELSIYKRALSSNEIAAVYAAGIAGKCNVQILDLKMYAGLIIVGPIGANCNIQASPNLNSSNWTTLTNITLPSQTYIYIDYNSPTNTKQFYRVVSQ